MKVTAEVPKPYQIDVDIEGITLLSEEEAEQLPQKFRQCTTKGKPCRWWLRSPGSSQDTAVEVDRDGFVEHSGFPVGWPLTCVRPALKISNLKSLNLELYDTVRIFDRDWFVISEEMVLSQETIGQTAFRFDKKATDANIYEKSDIKRYLEYWLKHQFAAIEDPDIIEALFAVNQVEKEKSFNDLMIEGITLLSAEEAEQLPMNIRICTYLGQLYSWWLRSPGYYQDFVVIVLDNGIIDYEGCYIGDMHNAVRPILKISNLKYFNLKKYDIIKIFGRNWIVISDNTVLSQVAIGCADFRTDRYAPDANNYEKSDIKKFLYEWLVYQLAVNN